MKLTIEEIRQAMKELGIDEETMTNHQWEEDGEKCSAWTIKAGGMAVMTGDGGAELFLEEVKKRLKHELDNRHKRQTKGKDQGKVQGHKGSIDE